MTSLADKGRSVFQAKIDSLPAGGSLRLVPQEFPAPILLTRPITLDGQGATVWALQGPVLTVAAPDVVLHNLRIEVTGGPGDNPEEDCALLIRPGGDVRLTNVEVRGCVIGLPEEEGVWRYPSSVWLGQLPHGQEYECLLRLAVPVPCEIVSHIAGLEAVPRRLTPGRHEVRLRIEPLPHDTLLNGTLTLNSAALRRTLLVSAHVQTAKDPGQAAPPGAVVWEPPDWASLPEQAPPPRLQQQSPSGSKTLLARPAAESARAPDTLTAPVPSDGVLLTPPDVWSIDEPAAPATFTVSPKPGDGLFRTIAEALRVAPAGATIQVKPGTYREGIVLDRHLEIVGDGPAADVVVECADAPCLNMRTDQATVRGLTLRGSAARGSRPRYAVDVPQGQLTLQDCIITSDSLACVAIHGSAPVLRRCRIEGGASAGVLVYDKGRGLIEDCDIAGHALAGVEIRQGGEPVLRRCRIRDGKEVGVLVHDRGKGTLEECDVHGHALANVEVRTEGSPTLHKCTIRDGRHPGLRVLDRGAGEYGDCDIAGNALAGVEIGPGGNPRLHGCRIHDGRQVGVLCGRNAQGTLEECEVSGNALAGVQIGQGARTVLRRCTLHDNREAGAVIADKAEPRLEECDVFANALAGVEIVRDAAPVLRQCKVHDNRREGVLVSEGGRGTLEECDAFLNDGAGILVARGGDPKVVGGYVRNGKGAGLVVDDARGRFEKVEIFGNAAAGVALLGGAEARLSGCTISRNGDVGLWAAPKSKGEVRGCPLRDNKNGDVHTVGSKVVIGEQ